MDVWNAQIAACAQSAEDAWPSATDGAMILSEPPILAVSWPERAIARDTDNSFLRVKPLREKQTLFKRHRLKSSFIQAKMAPRKGVATFI